MKLLYTLGYEKRSIQQFIALLKDARIDVLVDVRETAWSHKPGFSKGALQSALNAAGIAYVHARFAGNPRRFRAAARSHEECLRHYGRHLEENPHVVADLDSLLVRFQSQGLRVCLTCFERHPDDCHRSILAEAWRSAREACVEHLATGGCRRLLTA